MKKTMTGEEYMEFLSLAPTSILEQVNDVLLAEIQNFTEDSTETETETISVMLMMLVREYELRQVEPLWRKAKRFAVRNSQTFKQVGKIAACISAGVFLGVSLDD
jgi:hypothetical protein